MSTDQPIVMSNYLNVDEKALAKVLRRQMVTRWWDGAEAEPDRDAVEVAAVARRGAVRLALAAAVAAFALGLLAGRR